MKMVVFFMTLFFQSWLHGTTALVNIGWPWNIWKSKDFVNVLSIAMALESKHNILHTFPWALMDASHCINFMLAPGLHEKFKINCYQNTTLKDWGRIFHTIFLFLHSNIILRMVTWMNWVQKDFACKILLGMPTSHLRVLCSALITALICSIRGVGLSSWILITVWSSPVYCRHLRLT